MVNGPSIRQNRATDHNQIRTVYQKSFKELEKQSPSVAKSKATALASILITNKRLQISLKWLQIPLPLSRTR